MSKKPIVQQFENKYLKKDLPPFRVGDTVRVHTRITEGNKERVQIFTGTVIARKGSGLSETFSVHRVAYGEGMERVFLVNSPRIAQIEVVRHGDVRRSKLYYLRGTHGKKAKVKSLVGGRSLQVETEAGDAYSAKGEESLNGSSHEEIETIDNAENNESAGGENGAESEAEETEKADA